MEQEDFVKLRRDLSAIRDRIEKLHEAINEHVKAIRAADERQRDKDVARKPTNVVVSYDDKTIADVKAENDRQYGVQNRIRWTAFYAFTAALLYAGIAAIQLHEMSVQTAEVFRQSQVDNVNASLAVSQWLQQFKVSQEQAMATQDNVTAIKNQMRLEERAWLGTSDYTYTLGETGPITSAAIVLNTGKSPATDIVCRISGTTKVKSHTLTSSDIVYPPKMPPVKQGTIFPNQHFSLVAHGTPMEPEEQRTWFENVQNEELIQYFYGEVRYKDIFGERHWTHFCTEFVPATKSGTPCPIYNTADETQTEGSKQKQK